MITMKNVDLEVVRTIPTLAALKEAHLRFVLARSRMEHYSRGQVLFIQGDAADRFFVVLEGWISVYRATPEGDQTVLHVVRARESFAEPAALALGHYPASAQAATDCTLLEVSAKAFAQVMREDSEAALNTIAQMAQRLHYLVGQFERRHVKTAPQRLADFLLELVPEGKVSANVTLPYDKALLAARLGMTPESLSRALARLRPEGVESGRGPGIEIQDVSRLRVFSEGIG